MFMKWSAIGSWAVLTEVLAHVLSLSWGFGMLVVAFVWVAGMLRIASVKAQTTEARVNALIPQVGTINTTANNAQSTANSAQSTANAVQSQVGGLSIPQTRGGGMTSAPVSYNQSWGASVVTEVTQINSQLQAAGIFV